MEESLPSEIEPCLMSKATVAEALGEICDACGKITLSVFLKSPSISLRLNHRGLNQKAWIKALIQNVPITRWIH